MSGRMLPKSSKLIFFRDIQTHFFAKNVSNNTLIEVAVSNFRFLELFLFE